ncbi:MAG: acylphosphatase [Nocardioidaceae bacterium]|nr:acylphosphatase [Nocardioidaceae bacterium]
MIRRRVVVHGDVQGVFFRDGCRSEAAAVGVTGWVRNRRDGAVEAVFEGDDAAVESLCGWCETGPPHAQVDRVDVTEEQPAGDCAFEVR